MQNIVKILNNELLIKISKIILTIIATPFVAYILNLVLLTLFNLGYGTGSFMKNLYNLIS